MCLMTVFWIYSVNTLLKSVLFFNLITRKRSSQYILLDNTNLEEDTLLKNDNTCNKIVNWLLIS